MQFPILEIPFFLAQLHRSIRGLVVHARRTAFGDARGRSLVDDLLRVVCSGFHRRGTGHVAHGAETHREHFYFLARLGLNQMRYRNHRIATADHFALMRVIDFRDIQLLAGDVLPDIHLRPVADREYADVLAGVDARVVDVPQLGALVLRVPLAELVTEREDAFLGARLFLVAARTAPP